MLALRSACKTTRRLCHGGPTATVKGLGLRGPEAWRNVPGTRGRGFLSEAGRGKGWKMTVSVTEEGGTDPAKQPPVTSLTSHPVTLHTGTQRNDHLYLVAFYFPPSKQPQDHFVQNNTENTKGW